MRYATLIVLLLTSCSVARQSSHHPTKACPLAHGEPGYFFIKTDIPPDFNGGYFRWITYAQQQFDFHYLLRHLPDTLPAFHDSITVRFVVTRDGGLCNLHLLSGNPILWVPTLRLLRRSHWIPGTSAGRQLDVWRTLRVSISIDRRSRTFAFDKSRKNYDMANGH